MRSSCTKMQPDRCYFIAESEETSWFQSITNQRWEINLKFGSFQFVVCTRWAKIIWKRNDTNARAWLWFKIDKISLSLYFDVLLKKRKRWKETFCSPCTCIRCNNTRRTFKRTWYPRFCVVIKITTFSLIDVVCYVARACTLISTRLVSCPIPRKLPRFNHENGEKEEQTCRK